MATRVAIVGATGYAGSELTAILAKHPEVELVGLYSSRGGARGEIAPALPHLIAEPFDLDTLVAANAEIVFLATPNEVSAELAPELLDRGMRVIDLSGAFRLDDPAMYPSWYGFKHARPALLEHAVYGLTEWCNGELKNAKLVANPGCYPTSILLALRPLIYAIDREQPVICDSKSGVSGAGKKADLQWSFAELFGNFKAYGVGNHRHEPEIRQQLHLGDRAPLVFVPHLLPTVRGILSTIHVGFLHAMSEQQITDAYTKSYANAPLVETENWFTGLATGNISPVSLSPWRSKGWAIRVVSRRKRRWALSPGAEAGTKKAAVGSGDRRTGSAPSWSEDR